MREILRTKTTVCIAALVCGLAPLLIAQQINAQAALAVPAGLPDWAFNIPDKEPAKRRAAGRRDQGAWQREGIRGHEDRRECQSAGLVSR